MRTFEEKRKEEVQAHIGCLSLLCELAVKVDEDDRECIAEALHDSEKMYGTIWKRVVNRFEITGFDKSKLEE